MLHLEQYIRKKNTKVLLSVEALLTWTQNLTPADIRTSRIYVMLWIKWRPRNNVDASRQGRGTDIAGLVYCSWGTVPPRMLFMMWTQHHIWACIILTGEGWPHVHSTSTTSISGAMKFTVKCHSKATVWQRELTVLSLMFSIPRSKPAVSVDKV